MGFFVWIWSVEGLVGIGFRGLEGFWVEKVGVFCGNLFDCIWLG